MILRLWDCCDLLCAAQKEHLAFVSITFHSSQTPLNLVMTSLSPEQCRQALTSSQRLVLTSFEYGWDVLTIKDIRKETKGKISVKTIRRALAKLADMGILKRTPAERKGRGYSNLYRLASSKDEEEVRDDEGKEEEVRKNEVREEGDPLSELDDLLARYKKAKRT